MKPEVKIENLVIKEEMLNQTNFGDLFYKIFSEGETDRGGDVYAVEIESLYNDRKVNVEFSLVVKRCKIHWDEESYNVSMYEPTSIEPFEVKLEPGNPVIQDLYLNLLLKASATAKKIAG